PPSPEKYGSVTVMAAAAATAASTAVPPAASIWIPAWVASGLAEATMPRRPNASGRTPNSDAPPVYATAHLPRTKSRARRSSAILHPSPNSSGRVRCRAEARNDAIARSRLKIDTSAHSEDNKAVKIAHQTRHSAFLEG